MRNYFPSSDKSAALVPFQLNEANLNGTPCSGGPDRVQREVWHK